MEDIKKTTLYKLYSDYMHELWLFSGKDTEKSLRKWFDEIYNAPDIELYQIKEDEKTKEIIGFLVVKVLDEKHRKETGSDKYICEAYIKPEYRNRGLMSNIIKDRYIKNGTPVTMHILKKNEKAKIFWSDVFMRNHYTYEHLCEKDKLVNGDKCEFIRFVKVS